MLYLTNGQVAWTLEGPIGEMYHRGFYTVPKGWRVLKRVTPGKYLWDKEFGCYVKQSIKQNDHCDNHQRTT